jgi:hypothetical protein
MISKDVFVFKNDFKDFEWELKEENIELTNEDIEELKTIRKRIGNIIHGKTER